MVASVSLAYMPHTVGLGAGAAMFLGGAIVLAVLQVQYLVAEPPLEALKQSLRERSFS